MIELICVDLDDTLIDTQPLYNDKKHKLAKWMTKLGFDYYRTLDLQKEIDQNLWEVHGAASHRFPKSFVETYRTLCKSTEKQPCSDMEKEIEELAYRVYEDISKPFGFSEKIVHALRNYQKCIFTRGDKSIQLKRIVDSGLGRHFEQIFVVTHKTPVEFKKICRYFGVGVENTAMVGDSMRGDIVPALEAGLYGIHINNGTLPYEKPIDYPEDHPRLVVLKSLEHLPNAIRRLDGEVLTTGKRFSIET